MTKYSPEQAKELFKKHFEGLYEVCEDQGWGDPFSYARSREIHMAIELGHEVSSLGIARMYQGICDTFVLDNTDIEFEADIRKLGMDVCVTDTIMESLEDKIGLARVILEICN